MSKRKTPHKLTYYKGYFDPNTLKGSPTSSISERADNDELLKNLSLRKFGEYFLKCSGRLNAQNVHSTHNNRLTYVVGKTIGVNLSYPKNCIFASKELVFNMLHKSHIGLVNKKEKSLPVSDFMKLKNEILERYPVKIKSALSIFKRDDINCTTMINLSNDNYDTYIGHMLGKIKRVPKDRLIIRTPKYDTIDFTKKPTDGAPSCRQHFCVYDQHGFNFFLDDKLHNESHLFHINMTVGVWTNGRNSFSFNNHFHTFDINLTSKILEAAGLFNEFTDWYNNELEILKDKYSYNFLMNSLDDEDCLI